MQNKLGDGLAAVVLGCYGLGIACGYALGAWLLA